MDHNRATKEECWNVKQAVEEIVKAFPKSKAEEFFGRFNDLMVFLSDCERVLPSSTAITGRVARCNASKT